MFRSTAAAVAALTVCAAAGAAQAGPASDAFAQCVTAKATEQDRNDLVVWAFSAISAHPAAQRYANINDAERQALSKQAGAVMQRLSTVDCRKEAVAAIRAEGQEGFESAFRVFGENAMAGMATDPKVAEALSSIVNHVDLAKFAALMVEAGALGGAVK